MVSDICARAETLWTSRLATSIIRIAAAVFCEALMIPSPSLACRDFYGNYYLKKHLSGYLAGRAVIATLVSNQKTNTKVLLLPGVAGLTFYFRKASIISVGHHTGPAGYMELWTGVEQGNCLPYLTRLDVSVVIVQPHHQEAWWPRFYDQFRAQLKEYGFREYCTEERNVAIFLRGDIHASRKLLPAN
jgi:hypothetical protein